MLLRAVFGKHSVSVVFFSPTRGDFVVFADVMVFDCSYILKCHRYQELRTLRLRDTSPTGTGHFAYETFHLLDSSPTYCSFCEQDYQYKIGRGKMRICGCADIVTGNLRSKVAGKICGCNG